MRRSRRKYKKSRPKVRVGLPEKRPNMFEPAFDPPLKLRLLVHSKWDEKGSVIDYYKSFSAVSDPNLLGVRCRTLHMIENGSLQVHPLSFSAEVAPISEFDQIDSGSELEEDGERGETKPKFLCHIPSHKVYSSLGFNDGNEIDSPSNILSLTVQLNNALNKDKKESMAEFLEDFQREKSEKSFQNSSVHSDVFRHEFGGQSIIEVLDFFQEKRYVPQEDLEMKNRINETRLDFIPMRSTTSGEKNLVHNDLPESLDCASSSDDEDICRNDESVIQPWTIVDQFQDALEAVLVEDKLPDIILPRRFGNGLYGKLQNMMQTERERDANFIRRSQAITSPKDKGSYMDVEILSRSLEAKFSVCCCACIGAVEPSQMERGTELRNLAVIFSERICSNVEPEVGKLIRVHAPWKEVRVKEKGELIILATRFSQI